MDWNEQLFSMYDNRNDDWESIEHFIETEIIEKLIEDIPSDPGTAGDNEYIKQQLRAKWLGKEHNA